MELTELYKNCNLCPRECGVDRTKDELGYCKMSGKMKIAFAGLHKGEEPVVSGKNGSGTIFFSGCTLKCEFCQNYQISHCQMGTELEILDFVKICLNLQEAGALNINLVTGTHFLPGISQGIKLAKEKGLNIPIVWNTSSYERFNSLEGLNSFVDIYLADIKNLNNKISGDLLNAANYPEITFNAVSSMIRAKELIIEDDILKQGVIVRHLVLPGEISSTEKFLKIFSNEFKDKAILSLMVQYIPPKYINVKAYNNKSPENYLSEKEYTELLILLEKYDIEDGFLQELDGNAEWVPDFNRKNPFPDNLAKPIWNWNKGFIQDL